MFTRKYPFLPFIPDDFLCNYWTTHVQVTEIQIVLLDLVFSFRISAGGGGSEPTLHIKVEKTL